MANTHVYQHVDTKCFNALTGIQATVKILNLLRTGRDIFSSTKRPSDMVLDTDLERLFRIRIDSSVETVGLPRLRNAAPEATATAEPPLLPPATTQELGRACRTGLSRRDLMWNLRISLI
jgi:hypothetical protein